MVRARCAERWDHTAALLATAINQNRSKSSHAVSALDLNPYRRAESRKPRIKLNSKDSMRLLKQVFIDHRAPDIGKLMEGKVE